jgi:hypothetical protein
VPAVDQDHCRFGVPGGGASKLPERGAILRRIAPLRYLKRTTGICGSRFQSRLPEATSRQSWIRASSSSRFRIRTR